MSDALAALRLGGLGRMRAFLGVLIAVTGCANSTVPVEPPSHVGYIPVVQLVSKTPADARDSLLLSWHSSAAANSVAFTLLPGQGVCAHFDPAAADTTTTFSLTLRALRYEDRPPTSITLGWSVKLGKPFWTVADSAGQVTGPDLYLGLVNGVLVPMAPC